MELKAILEAALLAAGEPLTPERLETLFAADERPARAELLAALAELAADCTGRGVELAEVAGGWRLQVPARLAPWVSRLWEDKPGRYSRATLETLALIAWRQPITRGEIEAVRGVAVGSGIVRALLDRGWIRGLGHREVPGRPVLYGTTREFLDHFGLRTLAELPALAELRDLDTIGAELGKPAPGAED